MPKFPGKKMKTKHLWRICLEEDENKRNLNSFEEEILIIITNFGALE